MQAYAFTRTIRTEKAASDYSSVCNSASSLLTADWRGIFEALGPARVARLASVGGRQLPCELVEGRLAQLQMPAGGDGAWTVGADEAALLGALLPRCQSVLTLLDFT